MKNEALCMESLPEFCSLYENLQIQKSQTEKMSFYVLSKILEKLLFWPHTCLTPYDEFQENRKERRKRSETGFFYNKIQSTLPITDTPKIANTATTSISAYSSYILHKRLPASQTPMVSVKCKGNDIFQDPCSDMLKEYFWFLST